MAMMVDLVHSTGTYKSVLKKKVPVKTIYPEAAKVPMVIPSDLIADLLEVDKKPESWKTGKFSDRLTREQWEAIQSKGVGFKTRRRNH